MCECVCVRERESNVLPNLLPDLLHYLLSNLLPNLLLTGAAPKVLCGCGRTGGGIRGAGSRMHGAVGHVGTP